MEEEFLKTVRKTNSLSQKYTSKYIKGRLNNKKAFIKQRLKKGLFMNLRTAVNIDNSTCKLQ